MKRKERLSTRNESFNAPPRAHWEKGVEKSRRGGAPPCPSIEGEDESRGKCRDDDDTNACVVPRNSKKGLPIRTGGRVEILGSSETEREREVSRYDRDRSTRRKR